MSDRVATTAHLGSSTRTGEAQLGAGRSLLLQLLVLFLIACVFDPADKLLGAKVWLFVLCWVLTIVIAATSKQRVAAHFGLLIYSLCFVLVPLLSIAWYWSTNGTEPFEGFNLLKGYVLIALAPLLVVNRINLLSQLSAVLTLLAVVIIGVYVGLLIDPDLYLVLYLFGESTGIVFLDMRDYGSGVVALQVYFVTSPMLAISIAYYFDQARQSSQRAKMWQFLLMSISIAGMLLAGTRNNILVSLLIPVFLLITYAKNKGVSIFSAIGVATVLGVLFSEELRAFFDPDEYSNSIKLSLILDYVKILQDPSVLLFGQGLGAYHFWDAKSLNFYTTELTYLELIRNFGVFGALLIFSLVVLPVLLMMHSKHNRKHAAVVLGYAFYLLMCASNPNLFSSMGILLLSVILANIFLPNDHHVSLSR